MNCFFPARFLLILATLTPPGPAAVQVSVQQSEVLLTNSSLTVRIRSGTGEFSLRSQGLPLVSQGYWSQVGRRQDGRDISRTGPAQPPVITIDPSGNGGTCGEVALKFSPGGKGGGLPCEVEMRYTLNGEASTLYLTSVWRHGPGMPGFTVGEARHAMKLNPDVFDWLGVNEKHHGPMPSGADWDRGTPLNLKEARRITTGPFAGKAEHKYGYSGLIAELPAYGWASSGKQRGLWLINPSAEYLAGGPSKMELTGHLDVNREGTPVLLNMWHGSHYGGSSLTIAENEVWSKVIGPFAVHVNAGAAPEALWQQARQEAATQRAAWPFPWLKLPEFPDKSSRATVHGRLVINAPGAAVSRLRVGLAAPPAIVTRRGRQETVEWQRNSRNYQFWAEARNGQFELRAVRPGRYTLYAYADGIAGEFSRADVVVEAGVALDLGTLTWQPGAGQRTLWQIGLADRSAGEFRRGDEAGTWGRYYQFARDFPNGVNYTIGKSDWKKDWNYAHCGIGAEGTRDIKSATWQIHFELPEVPATAVSLRLGIAGNRSPAGVIVGLNGQPAGTTGPMPDTAVMHRDQVRGAWFERRIPLPSRLLKAGRNTLTLTVPVNSWPEGVLYDFVRLEAAK